jgi:hypothetical protein
MSAEILGGGKTVAAERRDIQWVDAHPSRKAEWLDTA